MKLKAVNQPVELYSMNNVIQYNNKYSNYIPNVGMKLNKLVISVITLLSVSFILPVEGGPVAYAACVEGCFLAMGWWCPPLVPACVAGCLPLLVAPTP